MGKMRTATTNLVTRYEMQREVKKLKIEIDNSAHRHQGEWNLKHAQLRTDIITLQDDWMKAQDKAKPTEDQNTEALEKLQPQRHNEDTLHSQAVKS